MNNMSNMSQITQQELEECRELRKIAKPESQIPQSGNMVVAESLLSDSQKIDVKRYVNFAIRVDSDVFFVGTKNMVPANSTVVTSKTTANLLGISIVSGG